MEDEKEQLQKRIDRMQKKVNMCFLLIITLSSTLMNQ